MSNQVDFYLAREAASHAEAAQRRATPIGRVGCEIANMEGRCSGCVECVPDVAGRDLASAPADLRRRTADGTAKALINRDVAVECTKAAQDAEALGVGWVMVLPDGPGYVRFRRVRFEDGFGPERCSGCQQQLQPAPFTGTPYCGCS